MNDVILNIVTTAVVILGSFAVVTLMLGIVAFVFYWALERIVDFFWGVRNVCEYLIDKRARERKQNQEEVNKILKG